MLKYEKKEEGQKKRERLNGWQLIQIYGGRNRIAPTPVYLGPGARA